MKFIPDNPASKREQRDTKVIIWIGGVLVLVGGLIGLLSGDIVAVILSGALAVPVIWLGLMHLFQPRV